GEVDNTMYIENLFPYLLLIMAPTNFALTSSRIFRDSTIFALFVFLWLMIRMTPSAWFAKTLVSVDFKTEGESIKIKLYKLLISSNKFAILSLSISSAGFENETPLVKMSNLPIFV